MRSIDDSLLDTNLVSEMIRLRPDAKVQAFLRARAESSLFLSVVVVGELRKGMVTLPMSQRRQALEAWLEQDLLPRFHGRILPVTQAIAERWGVLDGESQLQGRPLNTADGMIAATALVHGLTLVTRNVKDFVRLGVPLINPWD